MHRIPAWLLLLFLVACSLDRQPEAAAVAEAVELWNGEDLSGWRMAGPGSFAIVDGALQAQGGMGLLWYADRPFRDFRLSLEWQTSDADDNSGVFVRFPDPGDDPWVAVHEGYELQICDTAGAKHRTGSVYDFQDARSVPTRAVGAWNVYEITVVGQRYTVRVNGELVNEFEGERSREGYIGLQNHDPESPVRFRNLRVQPLDG